MDNVYAKMVIMMIIIYVSNAIIVGQNLLIFNIFKIAKNAKLMHRMINAFNAIQTIIDKNNLMEILMDNAYAKMVIMMIIKIIIYVSNAIIVGQNLLVFNIFKIAKNAKLMHRLINAFNAIQTIIDKNNLMEILMDNAYAKMVIMMILKIIYVSNAIIVGQNLLIFNIFKIAKNAKLMHRMINAFNAIQTIIDKNNLMEILMDNAYAKMVIMMIIKIIIYVSNAQHFGTFFFFTSLFF